eukprot:m51a1_g7582 putative C-tail anchored protein, SNARE domain (140) ;mRNA; r:192045-192685
MSRATDRDALGLFSGPGGAGGGVWGSAPSEGPATASQNNRGILDLQHQQIDHQEGMLDELGRSVSRQKEIALNIGNVLDEQAPLLDEIDGKVDRASLRTKAATEHARRITEKAANSGMIWTICALFLVIIALAILMFAL